ncbi:MAG: redox-sensing transcriptional repressor Rex [Anaerolineae bacterium]|nr:redox-sensing transcriptional repressor Rex [Anaerolineales bacterium]MCQ3975779.1 redox-sensing transcriptional repressor Rex [Anaerolineae bacterium]
MAGAEVPDIVIGRLPIYLRALNLLYEAGQEFTSSQELGQKLGIGSAQIRKDLSHFGEFGKQGTGYEINYLREQISKILHVDRDWAVALVGFGDLGQAIAHYGGFASKGFHIEAIFDNDPAKIGQETNGKIVHDIKSLAQVINQLKIKMAIIAVPASVAQSVSDLLIEAGVKAILNYAPITLTVPEKIQVQYIDPVVHLQRMTYYLV